MNADPDRAALVVMVGPPGSGKSTWVGPRFSRRTVFSLDALRRLLSGTELDMSATTPAVDMLRTIVGWRMARRLLTVVDSTNTRPEHRAPLINAAREHRVPTLAVVAATPLPLCLARNAARAIGPVTDPAYPGANAARVPDHALIRLAAEVCAQPPTVGEVDAVLTIDAHGRPVDWQGDLPLGVLAEPWLADTLDAPCRPAPEDAPR